MRTLQRKTLRIKIMSKELLCEMLILFQIDVVAKIFDPDPWNFYTKNRSLSALWIFFQNYYCIFRSRMASFSYIYFGMKHHVNETTSRFFEQFILNFQDFRSFGVLFNPFGGPKRPPRDPIIHVNNISCSPCRYLPKTPLSDLSKSPIYIFMVIDPSRAPFTSLGFFRGPFGAPSSISVIFHILWVETF